MRDIEELIDVDTIVRDTCDLIRARSENPGGTEAEAVSVLQTMVERGGGTVTLQEVAPQRPNLFASWGPEGAPAVLFLGHSDVVPAGEGWTGDPFEPRIVDGAIIGRGSTDMKGGLAAAVAACSAAANLRPDLRIELLCTVDEEDLAIGVQHALTAHPDCEYLACIVAEPTNLDIVIGCRGASNMSIDLTGASAHAGRPSDGASSIVAAATLIDIIHRDHLAAALGPQDDLLGSHTWNVGTITGGSATSMVPQNTTMSIDRRTMPGEEPEQILTALLEKLHAELTDSFIEGKERLSVTGTVDMVMPGFRTDPDHPLVQLSASALLDEEVTPRVTGWTAACEGGFIAKHYGAPTIIMGPGDLNTQAHQPDERVEIEQLRVAAHTYLRILTQI